MSSTLPAQQTELGTDTTTTYPAPVRHGYSGQIVLNDLNRPASTPTQLAPNRNIPDGSLYQTARARWYGTGSDPGSYAVLCKDYNPTWLPTNEEFAVVMTSSRWLAGQGTGEEYSAWWKYDVTLRPIDENGETDVKTSPLHSLSVKIQPQRGDLVQAKDHSPLPTPYGDGTKLDIQTTWVNDPEKAERRAIDMLEHALPYTVNPTEISARSRRFWKAEAHARFRRGKEADVVHVIRQTQDLIPHRGGDAKTQGDVKNGSWLLAKITTKDWDLLGYPDIDLPILLKVYYADNPETAPSPLDQPKIEAALAGNPNDRKPHVSEWEKVQDILATIVCQHLCDASVSRGSLVTDDKYDPDAATHEWEYIGERRQWLREHYASLKPAVYFEAQRPQTDLTYDILRILADQGTATYDELEALTGASRRTIREHCRRLEKEIGGEAPGVIQRIQSAQTHIVFANEMQQHVEEVVEEVKPDDTIADREERAKRRRERRKEREQRQTTSTSADNNTSSSGSTSASADGPSRSDGGNTAIDTPIGFTPATQTPTEADVWDRVDALGLKAETVAQAINQDQLEARDIKVRTNALASSPPE